MSTQAEMFLDELKNNTEIQERVEASSIRDVAQEEGYNISEDDLSEVIRKNSFESNKTENPVMTELSKGDSPYTYSHDCDPYDS